MLLAMPPTAHTDLLLPKGTRLFYIGAPKTGTTSLQQAARASRAALLEHGVHYPGTKKNHGSEVLSFMGMPDPLANRLGGQTITPGTSRAGANRIPPISLWERMIKEVEETPSKRVLISHEQASMASARQSRDFVRSLGVDHTHIVITLRPPWALYASRWVQDLKNGKSKTYDEWLASLYDPTDHYFGERKRRTMDQAGLVERWVKAAGRGNVTVIVVDPSRKNLLTDTFEGLLGLPEGTLTGSVSGGKKTNRSMSMAEAEIFRRVNEIVYRPKQMSWPVYLDVVRNGAIDEVLDGRSPGRDESRVQLPDWATQLVVKDGLQAADRVATSGARIVGDVRSLADGPRRHDSALSGPDVADLLQDIAVEAVAGAVFGAERAEERVAEQLRQTEASLETERREHEKTRALLAEARTSRPRIRRIPRRRKDTVSGSSLVDGARGAMGEILRSSRRLSKGFRKR